MPSENTTKKQILLPHQDLNLEPNEGIKRILGEKNKYVHTIQNTSDIIRYFKDNLNQSSLSQY